MVETGKAAVYTDVGNPFEIREYPVPDPDPNGMVVRITSAGICGSDLHVWRGDIRITMMGPGPRILGHEMTGQVARLGANVRTDSLGQPLKEGDRIVYPYFTPCRRCYQCLRGEFAACPTKYGPVPVSDNAPHFFGAYAEYYYMKEAAFVFKVPDELSDEMVTPVNCALSQVIYSLGKAGLKMGDAVVIQGAGGLGLNATAVARSMGAGTIIVIDGVPERLKLAKECGADEVIDINEAQSGPDRMAKVMAATNYRGADIVAEFVGLPAAIPEGLNMVRAGGTYLEVGNISLGQTVAIDPSSLVWNNKKIVSVVMYDPIILPVALDFLVRNKDRFPLANVVSDSFSLEQADEAFQAAEWTGKQTSASRVVITP
ncbi:MAG TPA: zinc-binding dehydrogenase [Dehalococcoidia bacterium]|nr:zinc-binding dehydrogenase [Dehalococcoidia bacterium]